VRGLDDKDEGSDCDDEEAVDEEDEESDCEDEEAADEDENKPDCEDEAMKEELRESSGGLVESTSPRRESSEVLGGVKSPFISGSSEANSLKK
jgi:hypothetical protein